MMKKACPRTAGPLPYRNQTGQTLLIIVVAMAVSLTVGLAISTRSLKTLKETSYSAQSLAAYHAAEAGVEEALKRLESESPPFSRDWVSLPEAKSFYKYTVEVGGATADPYPLELEKDKTQEIKLAGYGGSSLTVCWDLDSDPDPEAALEMTLVSGSAGAYSLGKYAVDGEVVRQSGNGFSAAGSGDGNYHRCFGISGLSSPQILRIKALYNGTSAAVKPAAGESLPAQSNIIESEGKAGDTLRKVQVVKSLPFLPGIFDFAVFTPQALTK